MSKKIKDLLSGLKDRADAAASEIAVVGKTTTEKFVADANVGTIIVDGSVTKAGIYGNGDYVAVKGYAGKGSVKSAAAVELTKETEDQADVAITLSGNVNAKLAAAAKVEFTAEDKKYVPASAAPETVAVNGTMVTVIDAKVTDAFGGAVMTDTASSKKYKTDLKAVVTDAKVNVVGGTVTNVFAGGAGASSVTNGASVNISGGKVTNVYAGGAEGSTVIGDVAINIDMNSAVAAAAMNVGTIYAGGKNANVFGNVVITVTTNGAQGSTGKIGKIVGAPQGTGVVFGSRDLVLDAFQGDFAATVKGMDTVTIRDNSAVTFSKGQDKSMVNAEYIIELSEADNSNQAAVLTVKSDYKFNKLSVSVDADLITAGGSFTRALIAGNKSKFNSSTFDVNEINVKKDNGGLIADYQYELKFDTDLDKKGNAVENGKLIFTYTGATLELGVAGYINREGVANVLSSADDVVSFGATWDPMAGTAGILDKEISYNFKTMAGDDQITIDDEVLFTGKLSVGAGNDTVIINGSLAKLDLAGAGENLVVVNGMLDARNIVTSADSANTFVINGDLKGFAVNNTVTHGTIVKNTYYYADGSWTEDEINPKKDLLYTQINAYSLATGELIATTTSPVNGPAVEVDRWIASLNQNVVETAAQELVLTKGDNTVVINNGAGLAGVTLAGGEATVIVADAFNYQPTPGAAFVNKVIDLRGAESSTVVIDNASFGTILGSREGASNIVVATDLNSNIDALDLLYKNATLTINQAVTLTVDGWDNAGLEIEDVVIEDNAELTVTAGEKAGTYINNFSGYKHVVAAGNLISFGTIADSVIDFDGANLELTNIENSDIFVTANNAAVSIDGAMVASNITFSDDVAGPRTYKLELDDAAIDAESVIALDNAVNPSNYTLNVTFRGDVTVDGLIDVGNGTGNFDFQDANVSFAQAIGGSEFIDSTGTVEGTININLYESTINLAEGVNMTVNNLTMTSGGSITGEGSLTATGAVTLSGVDYTFGADDKLGIEKAASITFDLESNIAISENFTVSVDGTLTVQDSVLAGAEGAKIVAQSVSINDTVADGFDTKVSDVAIEVAKNNSVAVTKATLENVEVAGAIVANTGTALKDVTAEELRLIADVTLAGATAAEKTTIAAGNIALTNEASVNLGDVTGAININKIVDEKGADAAGAAAVTAGEVVGNVSVTANTVDGEKQEITFNADEIEGTLNVDGTGNVKLGVDLVRGKVTLAGGGDVVLAEKLSVAVPENTNGVSANGGIDATAIRSLSGDVRVYDYSDKTGDPANWVPHGITVNNIILNGEFESDIYANNGNNTIALTGDTKIVRNEADKFNTNAYGSIRFYNGNDILEVKESIDANAAYIDAVDGKYASVQKDIVADNNLNILGNVQAGGEINVTNTLTLGRGGLPEDYVTLDPDNNGKVNANVVADIVAGALVGAGAGAVNTVKGEINAGSVTINAGGEFTQLEGDAVIAGTLTLNVDTTDIEAADYAGQPIYDGAKAVFNNVKASNVTIADQTQDNGAANAALEIKGNLIIGKNDPASVTTVQAGAGSQIKIGSIVVGTYEKAEEIVKFDNAAVALNGFVDADNVNANNISVGNITLDALNSNTLSLNKDMVVDGAVTYVSDAEALAPATNTLNVIGSAELKGGLTFNHNLTINFKEETREVEEGVFVKYAEFNNDITMSDANDRLTIAKKGGGTAAVVMKNINFGNSAEGEFDTFVVNTDVVAESVTAAGNLQLSGTGTIDTDNFNVAGAIKVDAGDVTLMTGNDLALSSIILEKNSAFTLKQYVASETIDEATGKRTVVETTSYKGFAGSLTINADYNSNYMTVASINGNLIVKASDLGLDAEGNVVIVNPADVFINGVTTTVTTTVYDADDNVLSTDNDNTDAAAQINGNINLLEAGTFDNVAWFGGKIEATGKVDFKSVYISNGSDITAASFEGAANVGSVSVDDKGYVFVGGQVGLGQTVYSGDLGNVFTLDEASINSAVNLGAGSDTVELDADGSYVKVINLGDSILAEGFADKAAEADVLRYNYDQIAAYYSLGSTLDTTKVTFNDNLLFGAVDGSGSDITISRGKQASDLVESVNSAFMAKFDDNNSQAPAAAGDSTYTFDGVTVTFKYIGEKAELLGTDPLKPADFEVTVTGFDVNTIVGSDKDNTIVITDETFIDGSISLAGGKDTIIVKDNLTLNAITLNGLVLGAKYENDEWVRRDGVTEVKNVTIEDSNVINFGAGDAVMVLNDSVTVTAAAIISDAALSITLAKGASKADIKAAVKAANIYAGSGVTFWRTVEGAIVTTNATFKDAVSGSITMENIAKFTAKTDTKEAEAEYTEAALGGIVAGNALTINNSIKVDGAVNDAAATFAGNHISSITGIDGDDKVEGTQVVSNVTINAAANKELLKDNADLKDAAQTIVIDGKIADLASFKVAAGEVTVDGGVSNVGKFELAAGAKLTIDGGVSNVGKFELAAGAKLTIDGDFSFSDTTLEETAGLTFNSTALNGDANGNKLTVSGNLLVYADVDFKSVGKDMIDELIVKADAEIQSVTFGGGAGISKISGNGKLTSDVGASGTLQLNAATIIGDISGDGGKDVLEVIGSSSANNVSGFEVIKATGTLNADVNDVNELAISGTVKGTLTGTGAADTLTIVGKANIDEIADIETVAIDDAALAEGTIFTLGTGAGSANLDLSALFADDDAKAALAGLAGKSFVIDTDTTFNSVLGLEATFAVGTTSYTAALTWDSGDTKYTVAIAKA